MSKRNITAEVKELYEKYPFPYSPDAYYFYANNITDYDLCSKEKIKYTNQSKFLEIGCGTGETICGLAKRMPNCSFIGFDISEKSLELAKKFSNQENITNIEFKKENLENINPENKFDHIISFGVLHHTGNAEKNFSRISKYLSENGDITIGLYNSYGRFIHRLKRMLVHTIAGKDIVKRTEFAKKIFAKNKTSSEEIRMADAFAHPQETYFTISEVLKWFKINNIIYTGSYPPIELGAYPYLAYIDFKNRKKTLEEKNTIKLNYLSRKQCSKIWKFPLFTFIVQVIWIFYLKSSLFFIRGKRGQTQN